MVVRAPSFGLQDSGSEYHGRNFVSGIALGESLGSRRRRRRLMELAVAILHSI